MLPEINPGAPSTLGLPIADSTALQRMVPDEQFRFSQSQRYWNWGSATGVSIALSGGVGGGKMSIVCDAGAKDIFAQRSPLYPVVTSEQYSCRMRWRRTGTITLSNTAAAQFGLVFLTLGAIPPAGSSGGGSVLLDGAQVNTVNVNEWQESAFTATVTNLPKSSTQLPFGTVRVSVSSHFTAGTIEVSDITAQRI